MSSKSKVNIKTSQKVHLLRFETEFDTAKEEYLLYTRNNDGVHPTKEGYEKFYVPYIVEAMIKY